MAQQKKKPEEDQYVLAFDPGGTTGMALVRFNSKEVSLSVLAQIEDGIPGFYDNLVGTPAGYGTNVHLVSEKWVRTDVKGADDTPRALEGVMYAFWPDQVEYQTPSQKHDITDELLKDLGVWTPGKPHQMDALRHALIWLRNQMHMPTLKMLGGEDGEPKPMPQDGEAAQGVEAGQMEAPGEEGEGQDGDKQEGEGQDGDKQEGEGQDGDKQDDGAGEEQAGGDPRDGTPLGAALRQYVRKGEDADEEYLAIIEEAERVYKKERDLDGAFTGWQPNTGDTVTYLEEQDF